jgi:hypothetical protein
MPGQKPGTLPGCGRKAVMLLIAVIAIVSAAGLIIAIYLERGDE